MNEDRMQKNNRIKNTILLITSMKPYRIEMLLTILVTFIKHVAVIGAAALTSYMVGLAMIGGLAERFKILFTALCICILIRAVMYYGEMWFGHDVAYRVLKDFRITIYAKIEKISPAFLLRGHSGQIGATLMSDVEILEWFLAHTFGTMLVAGAITAMILAALAQIDIALSGLMLVFAFLTALTPFFLRKLADAQGREVRGRLAKANSVTIEGIQGLREILTLNCLERYQKKNQDCMQQLYDAQLQYGKRTGIENMLMQVFVGIFTVVVMAITASMVADGRIEFPLYPMVVMLSALLFSPIIEVCGAARNLGLVFAAADRIQTVLDTEAEVKDTGERVAEEDFCYDIMFEEVSFRYEKDLEPALSEVSFSVQPGETVALVGPSGAGKSTCVNMLLRYWDVEAGAVKIGGQDIRKISLDSLHNLVSAVLQDVYLFHISVRENIRLGKPAATDEEVEAAARAAYAHEFIVGLPQGYDTITGERGFRLSGGQRQRIAIARAMLKNSPILILDEAVSSLDAENERFIQQALNQQSKNRTTLVVAHRLSTILAADKIVLIDKGRVQQIGTHAKLLKENDFYQKLLTAQIEKDTHTFAITKERWENCAEGYSTLIQKELDSRLAEIWTDLILENAPRSGKLKILDIGTGPGFFATILAQAGHQTVGIDCSENMIIEARENAEAAGVFPKFKVMDIHELQFEDNTFDLIVCRNVTWTLYNPEKAFKEWLRVLKSGGRLLCFDANWNMHFYNESTKSAKEEDTNRYIEIFGQPPNTYKGNNPEVINIHEMLPLSNIWRPAWDEEQLPKLGFCNVKSIPRLNERVYIGGNRILYGSTPLFLVSADKQ